MESSAVEVVDVIPSQLKNTEAKIENSTPWGPFGAGFPTFGGPGIGGGINPFGYPGNQGFPGGEQISEVNTGFKNMRWYFVSNMRNFLSELYVEIGLVQKVTCLPVDDALRGGVEIKTKKLDEDQIQLLSNSMDRDDDINIAGWAEKWNRLYGGAGILILTNQDPEEPFKLSEVTKDTPLEFRAVDMWELFYDKEETEGWDPATDSDDFQFYSYYGVQVHKSRVMRLKGLTAPSFLRPRLRGWGFSVVEALIRPLNQYLKGTDLTFEVTDEFKIDIYKIKNYVNVLMSGEGEKAVAKRINFGNWQKNYQNALVMDTEDEWDHKQLSFAGLAEVAAENRIQIAAELGMPLTKIFGISAAGFNSGEDDIEVYNSMIEGTVRNKIKYPILRMIEIKCQKLFGFVPDDLSISFQPLRMLSSEQEENVKTQKFNRLKESFSLGLVTPEEFREASNKGDLFDIKLDPGISATGGYMQDKIKEGTNNPYNPQDIDNPGADRLDTRKSKATEVGGAGKEAPHPKQLGDEPRNIAQVSKKSTVGGPQFSRNSAKFDRASYEAEDPSWKLDKRRLPFYENPKDRELWQSVLEVSREAYGEENLAFAIWLYAKRGGTF